MKLYLKIFLFGLVFFFGEIAISFSDKASENKEKTYDNLPFSVNLDKNSMKAESLAAFDLYMNSFIKKYKIKGASLAVCKDEKLVYAKGYGYANVETQEMVKPSHLFRIASVSKLITAVAVMKLYEEGKLDLDDHVFGPGGILPYTKFPEYTDVRVEKITIRHLLNHTAGWSRKHGDPMFKQLYIAKKYKTQPPASLDLIIYYTLQRKLDYDPGKVYSYSNLGYAILGEIISLKSGMEYEDYVTFNILKPLGIHDIHIGKSFYHQNLSNEVRYYENPGSSVCLAFDGSGVYVPRSYGGNCIELMGAAGGWVASAPGLAKFLTAIDGKNNQPDILKQKTIKMMTNNSIAGKDLFGWRGTDKTGTSWRTGTLSGSTSLVMKQSNGITWVVLLNTSLPGKIIHNKIAGTMFSAQKMIKNWPEINLFPTDLVAEL